MRATAAAALAAAAVALLRRARAPARAVAHPASIVATHTPTTLKGLEAAARAQRKQMARLEAQMKVIRAQYDAAVAELTGVNLQLSQTRLQLAQSQTALDAAERRRRRPPRGDVQDGPVLVRRRAGRVGHDHRSPDPDHVLQAPDRAGPARRHRPRPAECPGGPAGRRPRDPARELTGGAEPRRRPAPRHVRQDRPAARHPRQPHAADRAHPRRAAIAGRRRSGVAGAAVRPLHAAHLGQGAAPAARHAAHRTEHRRRSPPGSSPRAGTGTTRPTTTRSTRPCPSREPAP